MGKGKFAVFSYRRFLASLALASFLLSPVSAWACSSIVVGKDASATGNVMIARTEDSTAGSKRLVVYPAGYYKRGQVLGTNEGFAYTFPHDSYKFTGIPEMDANSYDPDNPDAILDLYDAGGVNEYGIACSATNTTGFRQPNSTLDPRPRDGWTESNIPAMILGSCKTIEEALSLVKEVVEGAGISNEAFLIADKNEAWIVEAVSGHRFVATRVPDDSFAIIANDMITDYVDLSDTKNYRGTADFQSYAEGANTSGDNFAIYKDGKLDVAATFGSINGEGNTYRRWRGYSMFAPSLGLRPLTAAANSYKLYQKPDKKISPADIMEFQRDRYNGTEYDMTETPQYFGNNGRETEVTTLPTPRPVGHYTHMETHIFEMGREYPGEIGARFWVGMAQLEHSVSLPFYGLITDTHPFYKTNIRELPGDYGIMGTRYQSDVAWYIFYDLAFHARSNRKMYGNPIKTYWRAYELKLVAEQERVEAEMLRLYAQDPDAAAKFITDYTIATADAAMIKAEKIRTALRRHIAANSGDLFIVPGDPAAAANDIELYNGMTDAERAAISSILGPGHQGIGSSAGINAGTESEVIPIPEAPVFDGYTPVLPGTAIEVDLTPFGGTGYGGKMKYSFELTGDALAAFDNDIGKVISGLAIFNAFPGTGLEPVELVGPKGIVTLDDAIKRGIAKVTRMPDGIYVTLDFFLVDGSSEPVFANNMLIVCDGTTDGRLTDTLWVAKSAAAGSGGGCSAGAAVFGLMLAAATLPAILRRKGR
jgi:dipeptidase